MKIIAATFLATLTVLVAGSPTPNLADKSDFADLELSPALSEVEKAQVMFNEAFKRQEPAGCDNHFMIDCGGDIIKSYNCWYWNQTRCWCGKLTSEELKCLADCECKHWDEKLADDAPATDMTTSLPVGAAEDNKTSSNLMAPAHGQKAPAGDDVDWVIPKPHDHGHH